MENLRRSTFLLCGSGFIFLKSLVFSLLCRFNCYCEKCRQPGSGQKTVAPLLWPEEIELEQAAFEDDNLNFKIKGEEHICTIPGEILQKFVR